MIEMELNPKNVEEEILKGLNISYDGWGGRYLFDWSFHPGLGEMESDLLIFKEDGRIIYGTGIFYRKARTSDGKVIKIALIGNGFTLPEHRRKGYSTTGINKAIEIAGNKGAVFLIGFVNKRNFSYKNMISNRGYEIRSSYLMLDENEDINMEDEKPQTNSSMKVRAADIWKEYLKSQKGKFSIEYDEDEFHHQYLKREKTVHTTVSGEGDSFVLSEKSDKQNRIILPIVSGWDGFKDIIRDQIRISRKEKRGLFHYTTVTEERDICKEMGFREIEGAVFFFIANEKKFNELIAADSDDAKIGKKLIDFFEKNETIDIKNGDRM